MMQFTKLIAITLISSVLGLQAADAQSLRKDGTPAEFPPSSFKGKQYVDSRGCVFIRAGVDGSVTWVPRVARDRKLVCGFQPSIANAQPTTVRTPTENVVQIVPNAPAATAAPARTAVVKPKPAPKAIKRTVVKAAPVAVAAAKPMTVKRVVKTQPVKVYKQPQVKTVQKKTVYAQPKTTARVVNQCAGLSATSQKYLNHPSAKVRCHSQTMSPLSTAPVNGTATYVAPTTKTYASHGKTVVQTTGQTQTVAASQLAPNTRVVPRHVYEQRANVPRGHKPPPGYKWVWKDGRLNHHRAEQTFEGMAQTDAIWTKTVPRRLKNGQAQTVYTVAPQKKTSKVKTVVSTKSAPAQKVMRVNNGSYVQVAAYRTSKDAQTVARRVKALGLPVRVGRVTRNNQTYRLVLAGPFNSSGAAQSALSKARSAGYSNARLR